VCGNKKCETSRGEDCGSCSVDCGKCDGCQVKVGSGCAGCKCEVCVCKALPFCCGTTGKWGSACVTQCKTKCGGCGVTDGGTLPPQDGHMADTSKAADLKGADSSKADKGKDTGKAGKDTGKAGKDSAPVGKDGSTTPTDGGDTGCECAAAGSDPLAAWPLLLGLLWLIRRRR